jgi:hypothetical protein
MRKPKENPLALPVNLAWSITYHLWKAAHAEPGGKLDSLRSALLDVQRFADLMDGSLWKSIRGFEEKMRQVGLSGWAVRCWSNLLWFRAEVFVNRPDADKDATESETIARRSLNHLENLVTDPLRMGTLGESLERLIMLALELHTVLNATAIPSLPQLLENEHPTTQSAAQYIKENPGAQGEDIDEAIHKAKGHFRNHIMPILKTYGYTGSKKVGYRPPK